MNAWVRRSLSAGALTAGAVMATGAAAYADTTMVSTDNTGILNGTQVYAPIQAPINLCGVAAAVGGFAFAGCEGGSSATIKEHYDVKMISSGNTGILNGTQVLLPIQVPVNVCGVAAGVLGGAAAGCEGGASASLEGSSYHKKPDGYHQESGVLDGLPLRGLPVVGPLLQDVLGGVSTNAPESARTESDCGDPCTPPPPPPPPPPGNDDCPPPKHHHNDEDVKLISKDNVGILNGTQVYAPVQVPIDASGIAAGVLGYGFAYSDGGSAARL